VGVERCGAVGADDPQVLQAIVIRDAVDVIEDQRHRPTTPIFILAAHLAQPIL
jgi:hypothetical protein